MALSNGIVTGAQAAKLNSYPTLSNSSSDFLTGKGTWTSIADATSSQGGLMPATDKDFLSQLLAGNLKNPTTNASTGALEYSYNGTVILSIPVASGA